MCGNGSNLGSENNNDGESKKTQQLQFAHEQLFMRVSALFVRLYSNCCM